MRERVEGITEKQDPQERMASIYGGARALLKCRELLCVKENELLGLKRNLPPFISVRSLLKIADGSPSVEGNF